MADKDTERFDIYDDEKKPTGKTAFRRKYFLQPGEYQLIVIALLETPEGRFLITKRAADKKWAAGWWEVPGGGVMAGETSREAVNREVREETGLDIRKARGGLIDWYRNVDPDRGDNYFTDIYHFRLAIPGTAVHLEESEAVDFRLASPAEIEEIAGKGEFLHYERLLHALQKEKQGL